MLSIVPNEEMFYKKVNGQRIYDVKFLAKQHYIGSRVNKVEVQVIFTGTYDQCRDFVTARQSEFVTDVVYS